jgi:hypothetical protein
LYSPLTTSKADAGDRTALEKTVMDAAAAGDALSSAPDFKPFIRLREHWAPVERAPVCLGMLAFIPEVDGIHTL